MELLASSSWLSTPAARLRIFSGELSLLRLIAQNPLGRASGLDGAVGIGVQMAHFVGNLKGRVIGREVSFSFGLSTKSIEGFDSEDLLREDLAELPGGLMGNVFERRQGYIFGDFEVEAGYRLVGDAAGIDELEVAEVGGDVEGKAVRGNSAGNVNADGANFAFASGAGLLVVKAAPDTGKSRDAAGPDAVDSAEPDQGFFHCADEVHGAKTATFGVLKTAEIEDGIADELTGAVVSDVAASVDLVERDAAAQEQFVRCEDIGATCIASESEYWRVFEEEERVFDETLETQG